MLFTIMLLIIFSYSVKAQSNGLPPDFVISSIAWSPDGTQLISGHFGGFVQVRNAGEVEHLYEVPSGSRQVTEVIWSPDGTKIASSNVNGTVQVRDAATGRFMQEVNGTHVITGMIWSQDNHYILATASELGELLVWSIPSGVLVERNLDRGIGAMSWDAEFTRILFAHGSGARILNGVTHEIEMRFPIPEPRIDIGQTAVVSAEWHPNGETIATGHRRGQVRTWDVQTGEITADFLGNDDLREEGIGSYDAWLFSVHFSPDGTLLTSVSGGGAIRTWNVATQEIVDEFETEYRISTAAWNEDGCQLAYGRNIEVIPEDGRLYDIIDFCGEGGIYTDVSE